jgi:glutathione S-transferase
LTEEQSDRKTRREEYQWEHFVQSSVAPGFFFAAAFEASSTRVAREIGEGSRKAN